MGMNSSRPYIEVDLLISSRKPRVDLHHPRSFPSSLGHIWPNCPVCPRITRHLARTKPKLKPFSLVILIEGGIPAALLCSSQPPRTLLGNQHQVVKDFLLDELAHSCSHSITTESTYHNSRCLPSHYSKLRIERHSWRRPPNSRPRLCHTVLS